MTLGNIRYGNLGWRHWARGARDAYVGCRSLRMSRRDAARWVWNCRPFLSRGWRKA